MLTYLKKSVRHDIGELKPQKTIPAMRERLPTQLINQCYSNILRHTNFFVNNILSPSQEMPTMLAVRPIPQRDNMTTCSK